MTTETSSDIFTDFQKRPRYTEQGRRSEPWKKSPSSLQREALLAGISEIRFTL